MNNRHAITSLLGAGVIGLILIQSVSAQRPNETLSFYMWCQDFRMLPVERCEARQSDDLKAYEQYRASFERYDAQQSARAKRDKDLQQRLDHDAGKLYPPIADPRSTPR